MKKIKTFLIIAGALFQLASSSITETSKRTLQTSCSAGTGWSSTRNKCVDCFDNDCELCSSSYSSCTKCKSGHYLRTSTFSSLCYSCGINCKTCSTSSYCSGCDDGYELSSSKRYCTKSSNIDVSGAANTAFIFIIVVCIVTCIGIGFCCKGMNEKKPLSTNQFRVGAAGVVSSNPHGGNYQPQRPPMMNNKFNSNPAPPPIQTINTPNAFRPSPAPMGGMPMGRPPMGLPPMGQPPMGQPPMGGFRPVPFQPVNVRPPPRF